MSSTFNEMKKEIEPGWDHVLWSESYGFGDAAALIACVYYGCAAEYLGQRLKDLAEKVGPDFLEQVFKNKGRIFGKGDLEVEAGDAYWSVFHRIWNPLEWRHEKVTTERYVRLYVRFRRKKATHPASDTTISSVMPRFRAINDISGRLGYEGGFPNFHQADYGHGVVFGATLLKPDYVDWTDIRADKLGNPTGVEARFQAVHNYAFKQGYRGGFPNFHQANYGKGEVYGAILIKKGAADRKDIPATELGNPGSIEARFRAVHDWAVAHGYRGGFPNFHQANHGAGVVYGTILVKKKAADWRDVSLEELRNL